MKPPELLEKISQGLIFPFYYFYGPEVYLIEKAINKIKEKVLPLESADFNWAVFDANRDADELILNNLLTYPINSSRRLTIIRSADNIWKSRANVYLDYLTNPNPQTCAIFIGDKADRREKFFQILEKEGALVAFYPLPDHELKKWVRQQFAEAGRKITEEALDVIIELSGPDLIKLEQEIQKLILAGDEGVKIDEDDVLSLSQDLRAGNPFALADAVAALDISRGMNLLHKNLQQGEPPFLLLSIIGRRLRLIWKAKEMKAQGVPGQEIEKELKIGPSLAKDFWRQVEKISLAKIKETWPILEQTEREMKNSRVAKEVLLEKCLWEIFKPEQLRH
ncbi:MAG: DNA polymerase III subunit delta [Thermodesulfobacteriota bacterium]